VGSALCHATLCKITEKGPNRAAAAHFLCVRCRDRLVNDLLNLPTLYTDCSRVTGPELVRVIRKGPRKSAAADSMNPAAADIRSAMRTTLASWAGLVAEERRLERPVRDIPALARFLARHAEWLARHPAAGELADEIRYLTRTARNVAYPDTVRRVRIGTCPEDDCPGELVALIRPSDDPHPSEIVCTVSSGHSWPVTWWTRLARRYEAAKEK
jgi:hypothetical protein